MVTTKFVSPERTWLVSSTTKNNNNTCSSRSYTFLIPFYKQMKKNSRWYLLSHTLIPPSTHHTKSSRPKDTLSHLFSNSCFLNKEESSQKPDTTAHKPHRSSLWWFQGFTPWPAGLSSSANTNLSYVPTKAPLITKYGILRQVATGN